eukprot:4823879-Amphidinium_carterae.1
MAETGSDEEHATSEPIAALEIFIGDGKGSFCVDACCSQGRGAYLRPDGSFYTDLLEESPFSSIIHSFWYVIVTITTVGYGDFYPTTAWGKLVGFVTILNGIVVLAMPVGVVGANFSTEYYRVIDDRKRRQTLQQQHQTMSA